MRPVQLIHRRRQERSRSARNAQSLSPFDEGRTVAGPALVEQEEIEKRASSSYHVSAGRWCVPLPAPLRIDMKRKPVRQPDDIKFRRILLTLHALREPRTLEELTEICGDRGPRTVRRSLELLKRLGFKVTSEQEPSGRVLFKVIAWKRTMNRLLEFPEE